MIGQHNHGDYADLCDRLVTHGWWASSFTETTVWWVHPLHGGLGVEIPETEIYESVTCWFEKIPTMQVLDDLGFPC
jgi:hypothetical protein